MSNGPTHAVNYKTEDFAERVKTITAGKGVNVVIDFVGQSHFNKNINALAMDGRMTMLALLSGKPALSFLLNHGRLIMPLLIRFPGRESKSRSLAVQTSAYRRLHLALALGCVSSWSDSTVRIQGCKRFKCWCPLLQRFSSNVFGNISGEEGKGSIKTYIHKVKKFNSINLMRLTCISHHLLMFRFIPGTRSKTRIKRWRRTKTCEPWFYLFNCCGWLRI